MLTGEHAYNEGRRIVGGGFYPLLFAAAASADAENLARLRLAFPDVVAELQARNAAPGGVLTEAQEAEIEAMPRLPLASQFAREAPRAAAAGIAVLPYRHEEGTR
jgi:hypothetical protein